MQLSEKEYNLCLNTIKQRIPKSEAEELLHTVLLQLLEKEDDREGYGSVAHIIATCFKAYFSNYSPYKYNKHKLVFNSDYLEECDILEEEDELADLPDYICDFIDNCKDISWWEKELVKRKHLENKTFKELAEETNIGERQVIYSYYKAIKKIRQQYEDINK